MDTNQTDELRESPRRWWIAGVLSYLVPGLGQVYNGQLIKGLLIYCLFSILGGIVFVVGLNTMKHSFPPLGLVLLFIFLIISLFALLVVIFDAIRSAVRFKGKYTLKQFNKWYIYVGVIIISLSVDYAMNLSIRGALVSPFKIAAESMSPSLFKGDLVLSNKLIYCSNNPRRGDIVIIELRGISYVKRVIGVPGDSINIKDKHVYINGKQLNEPYIKHIDSNTIPPQISERDNLEPVVVPPNGYFIMGDNRDNSMDSRFWGTIDRNMIKGKLCLIYWSFGSKFPFIRFNRIAKTVK